MEVLLTGLASLGLTQREALGEDLQLQELRMALWQLSLGKAPGFGDLPAEFYKHSPPHHGICWGLFEVCDWTLRSGWQPVSCTRPVLTLFLKKGALGLSGGQRC